MSSRRMLLGGALGGAVLSGLGFAGCAPGTGSPGPSGQPGGESSGAKPSGKLLLWDFGSEELQKFDDADFIKNHPDIEFTHVVNPPANYATLLQTAVTSPTGPDVVILGGGITIATFAPAFQPLDDRITADQKDKLWGWSGMHPKHDATQPTLGLPIDPQTWVIYYNKKLYQQAGLDPAKPPTSIPELKQACDALLKAGITPFSVGDGESAQAAVWFEAYEGSFATAEQAKQVALGELSWTSPEISSAFQVYLDFIKAGYFQKTWRTDGAFTQQPDLFSAGKAAMTMHLTTYSGIFDKALGTENLGAFFNPSAEAGGQPKYLLGGPGKSLCMTKRSTNKEAAYAWMSWRVSQETQTRRVTALKDGKGSFPTRKDVQAPADAIPTVKLIAETFATKPMALSSLSLGIAPPTVNKEISQRFGEVVDGKTSLADFLANLDKVQKG